MQTIAQLIFDEVMTSNRKTHLSKIIDFKNILRCRYK